MKLNENTALITSKVVLVPYEASHVETYSEWMSDETLRTLTASDRLSLPEEYAMQKSWRADSDKLTFICALPSPQILSILNTTTTTTTPHTSHPSPVIVHAGIDDTPDLLIGDINLFISPDNDHNDDHDDDNSNINNNATIANPTMNGEIELMIAHPSYRNLGLGKIIVLVFLQYILTEPSFSNVHTIRCKIGEDNVASLRLFEKLGFKRTSEEPSRYFREWELVMDVSGDAQDGKRESEVDRIREMLKG